MKLNQISCSLEQIFNTTIIFGRKWFQFFMYRKLWSQIRPLEGHGESGHRVGVKGKCDPEKGESGARCCRRELSPLLKSPLRIPAEGPANSWWVSHIYSTWHMVFVHNIIFPWSWYAFVRLGQFVNNLCLII